MGEEGCINKQLQRNERRQKRMEKIMEEGRRPHRYQQPKRTEGWLLAKAVWTARKLCKSRKSELYGNGTVRTVKNR